MYLKLGISDCATGAANRWGDWIPYEAGVSRLSRGRGQVSTRTWAERRSSRGFTSYWLEAIHVLWCCQRTEQKSEALVDLTQLTALCHWHILFVVLHNWTLD